MKPLKFRAWDNVNKCFIRNVLLDTHGNVLDYELNPVQDVEISYSTGLVDLNDNEIYEGDIVNAGWFGEFNDYLCRYNSDIYRIEFVCITKPYEGSTLDLCDIGAGPTIQGNKYENPELLDGLAAI